MIILFRSDTRSPKVIFRNGFCPRIESICSLNHAEPFESDVDHSIALSAIFEATPRFPVTDPTTQSWVYVVLVDETQDENQYFDLHSYSLSADNKCFAFTLPFQEFPKEKNVDRIDPENVICAFPVKRNLQEINYLKKYIEACDSFEIQHRAFINPKAKSVWDGLDVRVKKKISETIVKYNALVNQTIDVAQPHPKYPAKLKKIKMQNSFFVMKRLEPLGEYKTLEFQSPRRRFVATEEFLNQAKLQNSSGVLFSSSAQICKQNSLFYTAVTKSQLFDQRMADETVEIEQVRLKAKNEYLSGAGLTEAHLYDISGKDETEIEMKPSAP